MLKTRVITALVLLGVLLPSLFYLPQALWALLLAGFIGVAAWEWGALLGWREWPRRALGVAVAASCGVLSLVQPEVIGAGGSFAPAPRWVLVVYAAAAIFWGGVIPLWLRAKWTLGKGGLGLLVGALVLVPTWLALVQLRMLGPVALLGLFAIVWMADIAAYFSGKAFGKHKLAPSISPGKTWEGALGAVVGVAAYGLVVRAGLSLEQPSLPLSVLVLLLLTAISIVGDLYESMLKRQAGIKDSSNVLPGHGGVLDRIDSLTSTMPIVALLWLLLVYPIQ